MEGRTVVAAGRRRAVAATQRLAESTSLAAVAASIGGAFLRGLRNGLAGPPPRSVLRDAQLERSSSAR
jgi:hypothetical protein